MRMIKYQLFLAVALLTGVAIGFFVRTPASVEERVEKESPASVAKIADMGDAATIAALRRQVADLKSRLAAQDAPQEAAVSNAVAEVARGVERPGGRLFPNPREWMEEIRKTDPARYTQMTNRMAQWRQRRAAQARSKIDYLSSVDTSRMSAGAKKTHDELQELIARREEIEEQLHQDGITDEQRQQLFEKMFEMDREMRRLNGQERNNLFVEMARELGYADAEAREISQTVQDVIEATGGGHGGFGPPGPPGPPPGGGAEGFGGR